MMVLDLRFVDDFFLGFLMGKSTNLWGIDVVSMIVKWETSPNGEF
jgi:hypothetical protein